MSCKPFQFGGQGAAGSADVCAQVSHPSDNIRANGTFKKWTRPGMPPDSGGILRGCPRLRSVICPNVVSGVGGWAQEVLPRACCEGWTLAGSVPFSLGHGAQVATLGQAKGTTGVPRSYDPPPPVGPYSSPLPRDLW